MEEAGTERLLIDLRNNDGGNSEMIHILLYFLFGKEKMVEVRTGITEVKKYSPEYFQTYEGESLASVNENRAFELTVNDYNFDGDSSGASYANQISAEREYVADMVCRMPTFKAEYDSGRYAGYYAPRHVAVVCSAYTFSSGYTLMYYLKRAGALVVGTPSAQAGNCFGDIMSFQLSNSKIGFYVSHKRFEYFPDDEEQGRLLVPDHVMTHEKFAEFEYDLNSEILLALEVLR